MPNWIKASVCFWIAVSLLAYAIGQIDHAMRANAAPREQAMTFEQRAGHMFDRAQKSDKLEDQQQDLRGGVLPGLDPLPVHPWLFLSDIGGKRLESRPAK